MGMATTEVAAAKLAAKHKGVNVTALRLKETRPPSAVTAASTSTLRRFKGVTFHPEKKLFVARTGSKFLGYSACQLEAAKLKAAAEGANPAALKLIKARGVPREEQAERFSLLWRVYAGGLPGDLENAIKFRQSNARLAFEAPVLYQMCLRGKEGPWRDALAEASQGLARFRSEGSTGSAASTSSLGHATLMLSSSVPAEAEVGARAAHIALEQAMLAQRGVDRKAWKENITRNVGHHSGWAPLLRAFGVRGQKGNALKFHKGLVTRFRHAHQIAQLIRMVEPPRTVKEWEAASTWLVAEMRRRGLKLAGAASPKAKSEESTTSKGSTPPLGYELGWYIRTHLLVEMRAAGISSLKVDPGASAREFARSLPDQSQWVRAMAGGASGTLQAAMRACQHDGPAELFSMYARLFGDNAVLKLPVEFFRDNVRALIAEQQAYKALHGQQPHPAVLVQRVLRATTTQSASAGSTGSS